MTARLATVVVVALWMVPLFSTAAVARASLQASSELEQAVTEALARDRDLRRLEVSVSGSEATLTGSLPHLYAKNRAIELALGVDGIDTVASEIELPEPESDEDIGQRVAEAINRYAFYTMWDYLEGRVNEGVVALSGSVTADRDKKREIYEAIAKIPGVQDYVDDIHIQSTSIADRRLREEIARRLFRSEHFERFSGMHNPPFRIVVDRSIVTLHGYVQSEIEYREMERIIAQMGGVLRVENQLQVLR